MAKVNFSHVGKIFQGDKYIVKDFNLEVRDGELLTVVGPSGSGKTTVLRMLAGLEEITTGEIYIDDQLVNDKSPKERDISMVFQNYALFPNMTVRQNMEFALKMAKADKKETREKVESMAKRLEIYDLLDKKAKRLSGGESQRIALGRSLVCEPKVLLMDEPLSNIDANLKASLRTLIQDLQKELKITTLYVTHDQVEAMSMGNRLAIIRDGILDQVDTPLNVYLKPANVFVAKFIGEMGMNIFQAPLNVDQEGYYVEINGAKCHLPRRKSIVLEEKGFKKDSILVGIRKEDILLVEKGVLNKDQFHILTEIKAIEVLGSYLMVEFQLNNQQVKTQTLINPEYQVGNNVQISLDVNKLYFFDVDTEEAINF